MDIPRFWSERRADGLTRFGWSSQSQKQADRHAAERLASAQADLAAGRKPTRRERMAAYGGEGQPIREEIIEEHADCGAVITRNGYGARCLNVPDVLFADVDLLKPGEKRTAIGCILVFFAILATVIALLTALFSTAWQVWATTAGGVLLSGLIVAVITGLGMSRGSVRRVLAGVHLWQEAHPRWRIEVYRTPAGLRLLATHALFDPRGHETGAFFEAVDVDPVYRDMCIAQACFRARVSPKPWRIGIRERIGRGGWPSVQEQARRRREAWVADYEQKSAAFAACERIATIGTVGEHPRARLVRELHDRLCQIGRRLPLA